MPYRAANLLMAMAGLVAVAGLVVIGIDIYAASKRGPRWKRRLLGAGLVVVGMIGAFLAWPARSSARSLVVSCYESTVGVPAESFSATRLNNQLPLLRMMVANGKIDPAVGRKLLAAIDEDVRTLSDDAKLRQTLSPTEYQWAVETRDAIKIEADKLRALLAEPTAKSAKSIEETEEWARILALYRTHGDSDARLDGAIKDVDGLAAAGLLTAAEAGLLRADLADAKVERTMVLCYRAEVPWCAKLSPEHLARRLPLLEQLAASGTLKPAVIKQVLASVDEELGFLAHELVRMAPDRRAAAEKTRDAVKAEVEKLKKQMAEGQKP